MGRSGEEIIKDWRFGNKSNEIRKSVVVIVKYLIRNLIIGKILSQKEKFVRGVSNLFKYR
jgi:hypothetical protein